MFFEMNDKYTGYEYLVTREPQENYNYTKCEFFKIILQIPLHILSRIQQKMKLINHSYHQATL